MRAKSIFAISLVCAIVLPVRAFAQLSIAGKLMTYRTVDTDSGEELQRIRSWEATSGGSAIEVTVARYPFGTEVQTQCTFGNGRGRPATSLRSVMRAVNGELERSDFDTFDPIYYPFLEQPVTAEMQPGTCLNRRMIDFPALIRGDEMTTWMWSDSGLVGAIFHREGDEKLTVPADTFDAVRVRIDVDLSKIFPRVPELFLKLVKPHFTIWISRAEPYYVLKMVGIGSNPNPKHKNTAVELASIEKAPANLPVATEIAQVDAIGTPVPLVPVNAGHFAQGNRAGRVTLSNGSTDGGELLVTHVAFDNGLATESRTLIDHRASPVTIYLDDRSFDRKGAIARKHVLFFRKPAFPDDPDKELPADLYGADTTLGLVLPERLPAGTDESSFHVMDFYGQVNQLNIRKEEPTSIAIASEDGAGNSREAETDRRCALAVAAAGLLLHPHV